MSSLSRLDERMELAALARRRYPDMPLILALECFLSDRRQAGLGALDENRRRGRGEIRNRKWSDMQRGLLTYELTIDRPEHQRWPKLPMFDPAAALTVKSVIRIETVPARQDRRRLPMDCRNSDGQRGRKAIAQELRAIRREMRSAP